jgi:hypothetical protein
MNNIKKYFQFSGTISGLNFFLRNFLSSIVAMVGGFTLGYGIGSGETSLVMLGLLITTPALVFGVATIYKRMKALFLDNATEYTIGLVTLQIFTQLLPASVKLVLNMILLIISCILIFKNSDIENHQG